MHGVKRLVLMRDLSRRVLGMRRWVRVRDRPRRRSHVCPGAVKFALPLPLPPQQLDLRRLAAKLRFSPPARAPADGAAGAHSPAAPAEALEAELAAVCAALSQHRDSLRAAFTFYSAGGGGSGCVSDRYGCAPMPVPAAGGRGDAAAADASIDGLSSEWVQCMHEHDWRRFCADADLAAGARERDVDQVWRTVSFPPGATGIDRTDAEDVDGMDMEGIEPTGAGSPPVMMRFEFYEAVVRLACMREGAGAAAAAAAGVCGTIAAAAGSDMEGDGRTAAASAAVSSLLSDALQQLPRDALLDGDAFRREHLYSEEMEGVVRDHWALLLAMFKLFKVGMWKMARWVCMWRVGCDSWTTWLGELPKGA